MRAIATIMGFVFVLGFSLAGAQDPAPVPAPAPAENAAPAAEATPAAPAAEESVLKDKTIQEEISINLIDLDALRQAIESQASPHLMRLSLQDCLAIALKQNRDVVVAELEPQRSDGDLLAAKGEFDPLWKTTYNYMRASMSTNQQFSYFGQGISQVDSFQTTANSSVVGKLKTGTQYSLGLDVEKEESTYGKFIADFSSRLTLSLSQPLLRGFSWKANTVHIEAARNMRNISESQLRLQVMNSLSGVVKAYWDLVGANEALKVRQESLSNAERLLQVNEARRKIGTAADIEVLQAKAGVATRQSDLISARSQVSAASNLLKQLLDLRDGNLFSKALIVPIDRPSEPKDFINPQDYERMLDEGVQKALENRPELHIADVQIKNAKLDEYRAKQDMLPEVNLTGSYMSGGRHHFFRDSLKGISNTQDYTYSYGLQANVPIGNRATRGAHLRAKITRREAEEKEKQAEQSVMMAVHMAMNSVMTNQILVESNRQAVRLQEANVTAQEKRLRLGVTTSWQTLKVQEDLTAAQTLLVQAQISYEKSVTDLKLAQGTLLQDLGIEVTPPGHAKAVSYVQSFIPETPW
jgi:outer membrane protein